KSALQKVGVHVGWTNEGGCGGRLRGAGCRYATGSNVGATGSNVGATGLNVDVLAHARRWWSLHPLPSLGVLVLEIRAPSSERLFVGHYLIRSEHPTDKYLGVR